MRVLAKVMKVLKKIILVLLFLVLFLMTCFWVWTNRFGCFTIVVPELTEEKWAKISEGMSLEEVLETLPPPLEKVDVGSDHCSYFLQYSKPRNFFYMFRNIRIFFDDEDKVVGKKDEVDDDKTW